MQQVRKKVVSLVAGLAIAGIATALGVALQSSSLGTFLEQRSYDLRFAYRGSLPPSTEAPITILAIDEESLTSLPEPMMLWHFHFAPVLQKLAETGAITVGIDFLFADISAFDPVGQQELSAAILTAGAQGMPIVFAYRVGQSGAQELPPAIQMATVVGHKTGFANLRTDSDDFVRSQEVAAAAEGSVEPSFPLAIAQAYSERTERPLSMDPESTEALLINFRGPQHFPRVSFSDAVTAAREDDLEFLRSNFADRIVLIGRVGERGDEDFHSTPQYYWTDRTNREVPWRTPGVEIHANTITTLIEGNPVEEQTDTHALLTTLSLAAVVTAICLLLAPVWSVAASIALMGGLVALAFTVFFPSGYWLHLVSPVSAGFVALGSSQLANYVIEGREKRYLRNAFKRYVNPAVIDKILDSPEGLSLAGERRQISILFADIRSFTSRSEGIAAEALVQILNRYFQGMVEAIQSNGGMIDKFIGDGIMALFGAPLDDKDSASHSVKAAVAMLHSLEEINRELVADGIEPLGIGVGIHTGPAVVGNIGSSERMEYTAIGDVVNTAARIESLTRKYDADILISADTYEAVKDSFNTESLGSAEVKGKAEPVEIYKVVP
jgi:adenylate cyclase